MAPKSGWDVAKRLPQLRLEVNCEALLPYLRTRLLLSIFCSIIAMHRPKGPPRHNGDRREHSQHRQVPSRSQTHSGHHMTKSRRRDSPSQVPPIEVGDALEGNSGDENGIASEKESEDEFRKSPAEYYHGLSTPYRLPRLCPKMCYSHGEIIFVSPQIKET